NSFQIFVPTGNVHWSIALVSICCPCGRRIQRDLSSPSDQSDHRGVKGVTPGASVRFAKSEYNPVWESTAGPLTRIPLSAGGGASGYVFTSRPVSSTTRESM